MLFLVTYRDYWRCLGIPFLNLQQRPCKSRPVSWVSSARAKLQGVYDTCTAAYSSSGPSIVPVCDSRKYRHHTGNRHYSAYRHHWLFPSVPRDCTDTIAGNRHYPTGTIEGPLLYSYELVTILVARFGSPKGSTPSLLCTAKLSHSECK